MKQAVRKSVKIANNVDTTKYEYTLVVDANNLLKISLVNKTLVNDKNECYGGVYNFLRMLGDVLAKKDFNYCICCWDGLGSGVLRYNLYPEYKANRGKNYDAYQSEENKSQYDRFLDDYCKRVLEYSRRKKKEVVRSETEKEDFERQKRIIQSILEELSIRQYEFENVEGDDIISYYVHNKHANEKIVVMSSDKDLTQLIKEDICIWNPHLRQFVTDKNSEQILGITHKNVVLEKMLCGDASDNIKGIKGCGEKSLATHFPEIKTQETTLEAILEHCKALMEERKAEKKKPLKLYENIINRVTDGVQGDKIYEINKAIIDLSVPLLTKEASQSLNEMLYAPIDPTDRDIKNVYNIIKENTMHHLENTDRFGEVFGKYNRIMVMEKKRYEMQKNV